MLMCKSLSHLLCLLAALCSRHRSDWTFKELVSPELCLIYVRGECAVLYGGY